MTLDTNHTARFPSSDDCTDTGSNRPTTANLFNRCNELSVIAGPPVSARRDPELIKAIIEENRRMGGYRETPPVQPPEHQQWAGSHGQTPRPSGQIAELQPGALSHGQISDHQNQGQPPHQNRPHEQRPPFSAGVGAATGPLERWDHQPQNGITPDKIRPIFDVRHTPPYGMIQRQIGPITISGLTVPQPVRPIADVHQGEESSHRQDRDQQRQTWQNAEQRPTLEQRPQEPTPQREHLPTSDAHRQRQTGTAPGQLDIPPLTDMA